MVGCRFVIVFFRASVQVLRSRLGGKEERARDEQADQAHWRVRGFHL
jgi:hypothetical protein